jgi:cytochrome oxidase Cu insertion factor (SCO1/SenC/PrrC family)
LAQSAPQNWNRTKLLLVLMAGVAGLLLVAGIAVLASDRGREGAGLGGEGPYRGSEPPARIMLPGFELPSYRGARVSARELQGRVVLLTLLDSQCTDACPILASVIARSVDRLSEDERAQVRALAITGDPAEDTPASVRRFLAARRAQGRLDYLLGEERELRPLWTALQLLPSLDTGQDTLHSAPLRIYDRAGVWVATLHAGADLSEENLLHDIRHALAARGETSR